ncbi:MAG TPA: glycosyltransferase [Dehalococcoidia bacterium]|nr:glycosyltransferase [Dehalococcoidia bacterium]
MAAAPRLPESVSVVVPAYQAGASIAACVRALRYQEWTPPAYEVIVVDDGSGDGTAEAAEAAGARVIRQANQGPAAARNTGARAASGEILLFTDADCLPRPDWVRRMVEPFADPAVQGVKGVYESRQTEVVARFVQFEYEDKYRRLVREASIDFIDTYSAGYRRATFLFFGGFDTRFPGASVEDQELSFRLAEAGLRLVFAPGAVVEHTHAADVGTYLRKKFRIGFWKVLVHQRHPAKLKRDSHTPPTLKAQIPLVYLDLALTAGWASGFLPGLLPAIGWAAFAATGAGLAGAARSDPAVALAVLPLLAGRSLALGAGLAAGLFDAAVTHRRIPTEAAKLPLPVPRSDP